MKWITVDKLVFGGQGLGHDDEGRAVFLWNALPGESVGVARVNKRKGVLEAWAEEVRQAHGARIEPAEAHFGSCSPWQMMNYDFENEQKVAIGRETYARLGGLDWPGLAITAPDQRFGYRNKIEFSFYVDDATGQLDLAFFVRGSKRVMPLDECCLAHPAINRTARYILDWIRQQPLQKRNLKTLIVRTTRSGQVLAALFIKDRLDLPALELTPEMVGFQLIYSTHKSPASVITDVLQTIGQTYLQEDIQGVTFRYGIESFFQVYVEVFEQALARIASFVPHDKPLLDFYAGVGSIGLPLAGHVPQVTLVESNREAVEFANANITANNLQNAIAHCAPAEKMTELIDATHTLIVDPPRAGLHQNVVDRILEVQPNDIIYLSCNIATQARDLKLLSERYATRHLELFNFFPATPHIEGLAVLRKK